MVTHSPSYQTAPLEVAVHLISKLTSEAIRWELDNLQNLILDDDDRRDWSILNAELRARNEPAVQWWSFTLGAD